jgi:hypothetical protein
MMVSVQHLRFFHMTQDGNREWVDTLSQELFAPVLYLAGKMI